MPQLSAPEEWCVFIGHEYTLKNIYLKIEHEHEEIDNQSK